MERRSGRAALVDVGVLPGDQVATRQVEARAESAEDGRPVVVLTDILFPRPDELHRSADGRRDLGRLDRIVGAGLASEAAAYEAVVNRHVLDVEAEGARDGHGSRAGSAAADPELAGSVRDRRHGVHRLHTGVRQNAIVRLDHTVRAREGGRDVALRRRRSRARRGRRCPWRTARRGPATPSFPVSVHSISAAIEALLRRPVALGDDGDRFGRLEAPDDPGLPRRGERDDVQNAFDLAGLHVVDAGDAAAEVGARRTTVA